MTMLLAVVTTAIQAQDEPEYRLEIGAGVGAVNYLGDYNASLFSELQPMGAVMAKYKARSMVINNFRTILYLSQYLPSAKCLPHHQQ